MVKHSLIRTSAIFTVTSPGPVLTSPLESWKSPYHFCGILGLTYSNEYWSRIQPITACDLEVSIRRWIRAFSMDIIVGGQLKQSTLAG